MVTRASTDCSFLPVQKKCFAAFLACTSVSNELTICMMFLITCPLQSSSHDKQVFFSMVYVFFWAVTNEVGIIINQRGLPVICMEIRFRHEVDVRFRSFKKTETINCSLDKCSKRILVRTVLLTATPKQTLNPPASV